MDLRLPIPSNWQDFEAICHRLWMDIWNDNETQKNGRQGQAQNGVDIFGRPIYDKRYHAVQCKDKDSRLGSVLAPNELLSECNKAINFNPKINHFTIATTASRDNNIQEYCRTLNDAKNLPFSISVWSWNDIESEIAFRPAILKHFYSGTFVPEIDFDSVKLTRFSSKDHFHAFFSRPKLNERLSKKFKSYLMPAVYELMDNAYQYGKATSYEIKIEKNKILLIDNGELFNPLSQLDASKANAKNNIGSFILKTFLDEFPKMTASHIKSGGFNILEFTVDETILNIEDDLYFELNIDLKNIFGRENVRHLVNLIPLDKKEIILNIGNIYNISAFYEFIIQALNRITHKQVLIIYVPRHQYFKHLNDWLNDERLTIKTR
ncbi:hypothetical protein ACLI1A_00090 [Flavobacterium sp. RHBU_3]|uniref:hypothetical protein n=1 Tax=Flavobacterium sp. RHBU_3 TaxID=3391184 RepID=UPI0039852B62